MPADPLQHAIAHVAGFQRARNRCEKSEARAGATGELGNVLIFAVRGCPSVAVTESFQLLTRNWGSRQLGYVEKIDFSRLC